MLKLEFLCYHKDYDYFASPGWRCSYFEREELQQIIDDLVEKCSLIKITGDFYQKITNEQLLLMKLYCPIPLEISYY
jgi:hypothetical protein